MFRNCQIGHSSLFSVSFPVEIVDLPVSTRTRSSGHKQKKRLREEPDESAGENPPEKINRSLKPFICVQQTNKFFFTFVRQYKNELVVWNLYFGIRSAKEETEMQPDAVEPDAAVPEAKDTADGETEREGEEETSSVQDDQIMAEPENPVRDGDLFDPY